MNWNKQQAGCRISVQLVLVILLLALTFSQFLKLKEEITNVSISPNDGKQGLELPSITLCPILNKNQFVQDNMTFQEYLKHVLNVSDFFEGVWQIMYLPGVR